MALIAAVIVTAVIALGGTLNTIFTDTNTKITPKTAPAPTGVISVL